MVRVTLAGETWAALYALALGAAQDEETDTETRFDMMQKLLPILGAAARAGSPRRRAYRGRGGPRGRRRGSQRLLRASVIDTSVRAHAARLVEAL